jgi:hypothetical protein
LPHCRKPGWILLKVEILITIGPALKCKLGGIIKNFGGAR